MSAIMDRMHIVMEIYVFIGKFTSRSRSDFQLTRNSASASALRFFFHLTASTTSVINMDVQSADQMPDLPTQHQNWCQNIWCKILITLVNLFFSAALLFQIVMYLQHSKTVNWCKANVIVADKGEANFSSISAAIRAAPMNSPSRFCILIRRGEYHENIVVGPEYTNLVFLGDGIGKTILKPNRSDSQLATLWIMGRGFMARDLTIESATGSGMEARVALENWSYRSIFYQCDFVGFHATIHAYKGSQFYRNCQIQGSHYFIFGDARAVFQQCQMKAINLHPKYSVVISRQLRRREDMVTGFVFHLCEFFTVGNGTASSAKTYIGGPLEAYSSMTVVMQSFLDASIAGWSVNCSSPHSGYFGEFGNKGPGANNRTNSPCIHLIRDSLTASQFTVSSFLLGRIWIPSDVPYDPDLVK